MNCDPGLKAEVDHHHFQRSLGSITCIDLVGIDKVGRSQSGQGDDRFAVYFSLEVTPKATGQRMAMTEVGLYQVRDGKIVDQRVWNDLCIAARARQG